MEKEKLKPCPFCQHVGTTFVDDSWDYGCLQCDKCYAGGPCVKLNEYTSPEGAEEAAFKNWNRRTPDGAAGEGEPLTEEMCVDPMTTKFK